MAVQRNAENKTAWKQESIKDFPKLYLTKRNIRIRTYLPTYLTKPQLTKGGFEGGFILTEKTWVHRLYFNAYYENALMKMRSATGLGSTYGILSSLNEHWHEKGYMDEKGYKYNKERYGLPLVDEFEKQLRIRDQTARLEIQQKRLEIEKLTKRLTNVIDQWPTMTPRARSYYLDMAKEHPDLPIAQEILKVASNEG